MASARVGRPLKGRRAVELPRWLLATSPSPESCTTRRITGGVVRDMWCQGAPTRSAHHTTAERRSTLHLPPRGPDGPPTPSLAPFPWCSLVRRDRRRPVFALCALVAPAAASTQASGPGTGQAGATASQATTVAKLTFSFSAGWTTAQKTPISSFLAKAYPLMVDLYGPPSHSNKVVITADTTLDGWAFTDPPAPWPDPNGTIKIRINPKDTATWSLRLHYFTHEVLHAFHGFDFMPSSSLEEGETESAASLLRPSIAQALGIAWSAPAEPEGSAPHQLRRPRTRTCSVAGTGSAHRRTGHSRRSCTPRRRRSSGRSTSETTTLYKLLNAWWYARFDIYEPWTTAASAINSKLAALVPAIGPWSYATWRVEAARAGPEPSGGLSPVLPGPRRRRPTSPRSGSATLISWSARSWSCAVSRPATTWSTPGPSMRRCTARPARSSSTRS